jgi:hypothetical protein
MDGRSARPFTYDYSTAVDSATPFPAPPRLFAFTRASTGPGASSPTRLAARPTRPSALSTRPAVPRSSLRAASSDRRVSVGDEIGSKASLGAAFAPLSVWTFAPLRARRVFLSVFLAGEPSMRDRLCSGLTDIGISSSEASDISDEAGFLTRRLDPPSVACDRPTRGFLSGSAGRIVARRVGRRAAASSSVARACEGVRECTGADDIVALAQRLRLLDPGENRVRCCSCKKRKWAFGPGDLEAAGVPVAKTRFRGSFRIGDLAVLLRARKSHREHGGVQLLRALLPARTRGARWLGAVVRQAGTGAGTGTPDAVPVMFSWWEALRWGDAGALLRACEVGLPFCACRELSGFANGLTRCSWDKLVIVGLRRRAQRPSAVDTCGERARRAAGGLRVGFSMFSGGVAVCGGTRGASTWWSAG